jgi:hypothetical protein
MPIAGGRRVDSRFYPSCLAAADSEDASKQIMQAAIRFGAVTVIMKV